MRAPTFLVGSGVTIHFEYNFARRREGLEYQGHEKVQVSTSGRGSTGELGRVAAYRCTRDERQHFEGCRNRYSSSHWNCGRNVEEYGGLGVAGE